MDAVFPHEQYSLMQELLRRDGINKAKEDQLTEADMPTEQEEIVDFIQSLPKVESGQNKGHIDLVGINNILTKFGVELSDTDLSYAFGDHTSSCSVATLRKLLTGNDGITKLA